MGEGRDDDSMIDLPGSDEFRDIYERDEFNLDVFGLVRNQVRNLLDILG